MPKYEIRADTREEVEVRLAEEEQAGQTDKRLDSEDWLKTYRST